MSVKVIKKTNNKKFVNLKYLLPAIIVFFCSLFGICYSLAAFSASANILGTITASTCLVQDTKISLGNGETKLIQNVGYDDLLLVWNFILGEFDYAYPVKIHKKYTVSKFVRLSFDDGSTIDYAYVHNFFDVNLNEFIDFYQTDYTSAIGHELYKSKKNGDGTISADSAVCINAEIITNYVNIYFLVTAIQFNSFANGFMVSMSPSLLPNTPGITEDMIFNETRIDYINGTTDVETGTRYAYDVFQEAIPYYLYLGFRASESRYFVTQNYMTKEALVYSIASTSPTNIIQPVATETKLIEGELVETRIWAVSTSNEFENIFNDDYEKTYVFEGDYYILLEPNEVTQDGKSFIGWRSNADNQIYEIGDNVQIWFAISDIKQNFI